MVSKEVAKEITMNTSWDAATYDATFTFVTAGGTPVLERLAPRPGERILDLGCGTGELTAQIAQAGAEVVGLDGDANMVGRARARFPQLAFVEAAAETMSFAAAPGAAPFAAVFSNAALHWMKPAPVLARVRQVLPRGGRFVGEFGGAGNVSAVLAAISRARAQAGLPERPSPWFFPSLATWAGLLEEGGFEPRWLELVDRPTPVPSLAEGVLDWLQMFAGSLFDDLPPARAREVMAAAVEAARPALHREGAWVLDYRRLRFEALAR
jgi:SAM-dependent methyltransferase